MIEFKNVDFSFPEKPILQNFNFRLKQGNHLCIRGDSGKGKSSILQITQGYLLIQKGEVWIEDHLMNSKNIQELRKKIAWVPQNINFNIHSPMVLLQSLQIEDKKELVLSNMEKLDLDHKLFDKAFTQISGGQKQRLIIAICLSLNREILLLDEPTSSLDDQRIYKLIDILKNQNKTILSVSHHHIWAESADQIISI